MVLREPLVSISRLRYGFRFSFRGSRKSCLAYFLIDWLISLPFRLRFGIFCGTVVRFGTLSGMVAACIHVSYVFIFPIDIRGLSLTANHRRIVADTLLGMTTGLRGIYKSLY